MSHGLMGKKVCLRTKKINRELNSEAGILEIFGSILMSVT